MKTKLRFHTFLIAALVSAFTATAQQYVNGTLSTGPLTYSGVAAPAGYTWSETQHDTGNLTITNGREGSPICYGDFIARNRVGDDFVVPVGQIWRITNFEIFVYNNSTNPPPTIMPITTLGIEIWNGPFNLATSTKIYGDMATNVLDLSHSGEAMMYSIRDTAFPPVGTADLNRKIWKIRGNIDVTLTAGTYWVAFQGYHENNYVINIPLCKYPGSRGHATNSAGLFRSYDTTSYYLNDLGHPYVSSNPQIPQDLPFIVNYDLTLSNAEVTALENIRVYPNPVRNQVEINWSDSDITMKNITITDIRGIRVNHTICDAFSKMISIDITALTQGVYFLQATDTNGQTLTRKLIKE